ncbi:MULTISPECIES: DMT family transporter [Vibrio]|uniref:DMT family transporter n=2 Tax=Vibrionaceae TaxID=641 RepID=UPI0013B06114|nr:MULTISPECIES: SMR family transporter [Vibrio]MCR9595580.1 SMR family transporter [Vibrio alginolyticus]MCR9643244.1 SMR family transporter [Vibrio alginolyticus]MDW1605677.1 SMR family transporter [Vibrio sp. Vb2977]MDW1668651.1 SMR family transporter [Vibrio sp. Vb2978]MDW1682672.1 SMR family transporter [Vibrio sp. Vb2942]
MMGYLYLTIAIIAEVIGTSALKASEGFTQTLPSIVAIIGYGVAFYFLSLVLKAIPVGVAYAIWSGLGVVLVAIVGTVVFNQKLDLAVIIGMLLIIAGVFVMNIFSTSVKH